MTPELLRYGGGVADTVLNPVVAVILILAGVLMCVLSRRKALVPFLLAVILIPGDQVLVLAGLHFQVLRILIFFGMIRIFLLHGREASNVFSSGLNKVDKSLILLSVTSAVAGIILFHNTQIVIFQLGEIYTAFGTYFLLRCMIRDQEDVVRAVRIFATISMVVGGVMVFEHLAHGWNPYALLGGAHARDYAADMVRGGTVRAMGPFAQPIPAGTFGAVLLPLFIGLWLTEKRSKYRRSAMVGVLAATAITLASHSSTPFIAAAAGLLGLGLWPIRGLTRLIRWGIVVTLVSLHMVMKAPVWALITRFDISGSSSHRYELINNCVRYFWDWWLVGTKSNANWGWNMSDIADEYVLHAVHGGLLGLIFFIAIIVFAFKYLGKARQAATDKNQALFLWALSAAMLTYVVAFFGIALWDQTIVEWYALLAFIGAAAVPQKHRAPAQLSGITLHPEIAAAHIKPAYGGRERPLTSWPEANSRSTRLVYTPTRQEVLKSNKDS